MHILYLTQYYQPEVGATQTRAYEMATNLVKMGHQVTILTEVPNHPAGIIHPDYRKKLYDIKIEDSVKLIRVWVKTSQKKNFNNRIMFYISYMINAILAGLLLARDPFDLIYATSPPLFVGGSALILSQIKRIPFIFEVRDLWPESAVELGEISNPRLISWATQLEERCYRQASKLIVVTKGIFDHLLVRGVREDKLALIQNGANVELFNFRPHARNKLRTELNIANKFVVIYAGIFGIAQGLENIVELCRRLHDYKDIHFIMVGDGPIKSNIAKLISNDQLENISLLPEQPRVKMPDYLSASDAALIPLRKLDIFKSALPSKMFDAWACERPLILSIDGEARKVLESANGGVYSPPENIDAMIEAILSLKDDVTKRQDMGKSGREYTKIHFSRQVQALKLEKLLRETI